MDSVLISSLTRPGELTVRTLKTLFGNKMCKCMHFCVVIMGTYLARQDYNGRIMTALVTYSNQGFTATIFGQNQRSNVSAATKRSSFFGYTICAFYNPARSALCVTLTLIIYYGQLTLWAIFPCNEGVHNNEI